MSPETRAHGAGRLRLLPGALAGCRPDADSVPAEDGAGHLRRCDRPSALRDSRGPAESRDDGLSVQVRAAVAAAASTAAPMPKIVRVDGRVVALWPLAIGTHARRSRRARAQALDVYGRRPDVSPGCSTRARRRFSSLTRETPDYPLPRDHRHGAGAAAILGEVLHEQRAADRHAHRAPARLPTRRPRTAARLLGGQLRRQRRTAARCRCSTAG